MESRNSESHPKKAPIPAGVPEKGAARVPKTDDELRSIMKSLMDNPTAISDIPDEDIIELKQRINPVGTFVPDKKSYAVESIINMKDSTMRKFIMTAMIGFVYRRLEEYVPDFVASMEEAYASKINAITSGDDMQARRDALREECTKNASDFNSAHRKAIRAFLDSIFLFNPDKHVRKAPAELPVDALSIIAPRATHAEASAPSPPSTSQTVADLSVTRESFAEATEVLRKEIEKYGMGEVHDADHGAAPPVPSKTVRDIELATYEAAKIVYTQSRIVSANLAQGYRLISEDIRDLETNMCSSAAASAPRPESGARVAGRISQLEDARQIIQKCRGRIDNAADILGPYSAGQSLIEASSVLQVAPPVDVFYHLDRYINSHYEVLRILTDVIYQIPPGIENIVIYYDTFDELDKAKEYIRVHESEFRADPKIIENEGVTVLGPFRENRENVDFYNRNTEVLRIMMEQVSKDHQLGKDLTKKKIMGAKRKNIHETGPDDVPGLERYIGARGIITQFGKKPSLSREEREQLSAAEQTRAEYETPDGALAMRVLAPSLDENGIPTDLKQTFFYAEGTNVAGGSGSGAGTSAGAASSSASSSSAPGTSGK